MTKNLERIYQIHYMKQFKHVLKSVRTLKSLEKYINLNKKYKWKRFWMKFKYHLQKACLKSKREDKEFNFKMLKKASSFV